MILNHKDSTVQFDGGIIILDKVGDFATFVILLSCTTPLLVLVLFIKLLLICTLV